MPDPFDGWRYLSHLRGRWRMVVVVLSAALASALVISFLLPTRYTAHVSLLIEPPASSDSRVATAVSPIYLESLRSFEHFASSDDLFARALDKFRLREVAGARPIEKLKRDLLRVTVLRNTRIMQVEITYGEPKVAHACARYIADETVKLSETSSRASDEGLVREAKQEADHARERLAAARAAYQSASMRAPSTGALEADLKRLDDLRSEMSRIALSLDLATGELETYAKSAPAGGEGNTVERTGAEERLAALRARAARLKQDAADLDRQADQKEKLLSVRQAEVDAAEAELKDARSACDQTERRLRELKTVAGYHTERISILDPGVVPEKPSSPNIPLNLMVAAGLALVVSLAYLTLEYSLRAPAAAGSAREKPWISSRV